jgi:hypothetical protein
MAIVECGPFAYHPESVSRFGNIPRDARAQGESLINNRDVTTKAGLYGDSEASLASSKSNSVVASSEIILLSGLAYTFCGAFETAGVFIFLLKGLVSSYLIIHKLRLPPS